MSNWPATTLHRRDVVTVPTIGVRGADLIGWSFSAELTKGESE